MKPLAPSSLSLALALFAGLPLHGNPTGGDGTIPQNPVPFTPPYPVSPVAGKTWNIHSAARRGGVGEDTALCVQAPTWYFSNDNYSLYLVSIAGSGTVVQGKVDSSGLYALDTFDHHGSRGQNVAVAAIEYGATSAPFVAYYNPDAGDLCFAWPTSGTPGWPWNIEVVDNIGTAVGMYPSLKPDGQGGFHLAYFDAGYGHLRYAYKSAWNAPWQIFVVDADVKVGYHASLAVGFDGRPMIAYYDLTQQRLKFAERLGATTGAPWLCTVVDDAADVGMYCSLATDDQHRPHISYYDATHHALKYATRGRSGWVPKIIDDAPHVGQYTAILTRPGEPPLIAYYDDYLGRLKIADTVGHIGVVDDDPMVGKYCSIARFGFAGKEVLIAYWDELNDKLKYAYTSSD